LGIFLTGNFGVAEKADELSNGMVTASGGKTPKYMALRAVDTNAVKLCRPPPVLS